MQESLLSIFVLAGFVQLRVIYVDCFVAFGHFRAFRIRFSGRRSVFLPIILQKRNLANFTLEF